MIKSRGNEGKRGGKEREWDDKVVGHTRSNLAMPMADGLSIIPLHALLLGQISRGG